MAKQEANDSRKISLTKPQAGLLLFAVLVTIVIVGLLSGLLRSCTCPQPTVDPPRTATVEVNPLLPPSQDDKKKEVAREDEKLEELEGQIWKRHLLPRNVVPVHYDLVLFPNFYDDETMFYGNVSILINVTDKATDCLLIHIKALRIVRSEVRLLSPPDDATADQELVVKRNFSHEENEFWVIQMQEEITAGKTLRVALQFEGSLANGISGLYKSTYIDSRTGQRRFLATSKFQPTDARKAFPCLDEPRFKSTFTVTLIHRPGFIALSNMPQETLVNHTDGLVATRFWKSVPMVTYLACFIVCDFAHKETTTSNGTIPLRIFATPDKIDQVDYALSISGRILEFYEKTFGLPYPLPKLDQIAIPDFASGAMEHWGLVTYRESVLLFDAREASVFNKQRVAIVIAHELAHMWFGNLVTMEWWDDLWLNEGFASYVEYMGVNHVHPDWDMDSQFLTEDMQSVMMIDATTNSHPIVVSVDHPDQISEVFDSISYSKGASILRMLENFMGSENFRKGLQLYMQKYKYQIAVTKDLWNCLSQVDGAPNISAVMDSWTIQMGFPVVNVVFDERRFHLSQERFLLDPSADKTKPPSHFNYIWQIPLRVVYSFGGSRLIWLKEKQDAYDLDRRFQNESTWMKFNVNGSSFVRVNYPESYWIRLAEVLRKSPKVLSASDRSNLIDDAFSLARAGKISYRVPLELVRYIDQEEDFAPWKTFEIHAVYIREMLQYSQYFGRWKSYIGALLRPVLQRIAFSQNGTHMERMTQSTVISIACGIGDKDCLGNISDIFKEWLHNNKYIVPNLRGVAYRYGMQQTGQEDEWNKVWQHYVNSSIPQEKNRLLMGLAQAREAWLINRLLVYVMDETKIRSQDSFTAITYTTASPLGRSIVWDWARINWSKLVARFTLNSRNLGRMIPAIVHYFNTPLLLQEVEHFFVRYPDAGAGERGRGVAVDIIKANIAWVKKNTQDIADWLERQGYA